MRFSALGDDNVKVVTDAELRELEFNRPGFKISKKEIYLYGILFFFFFTKQRDFSEAGTIL